MDDVRHFQSIDELIRTLDRDRKLLHNLFMNRKKMSFRYDLAREFASKRDESLDFLRRYGVIAIHANDDFVELDETYLKFFEEVLNVNEEISIASVKECIDNLNEVIDYYLTETDSNRKFGYLKSVKKILRSISSTSLANVIGLKHSIDNTYKNEPNFKIKKKKLERLDEKRKSISSLINECEKLIDEKQTVFFMTAMDEQLREVVTDVKWNLREVYHNLLELDSQIISYLNLIEYQNRFLEKVQKLKYLRDQLLLETNTDIKEKLASRNHVWMEPRPKYHIKVSVSMLRNTDEGLKILRQVRKGRGTSRLKKGSLAEPLTTEELTIKQHVQAMVNINEIKIAFMGSGDHLFNFVMSYSGYIKPMNDEEKLVLFCQIASQYFDELKIEPEYRQYQTIEYPLIYPKTR